MQVIHHILADSKILARIDQYALFTIEHAEYRMTCYKKRDGTYMFPIFVENGYAMHTRQNQKTFEKMKALALKTIGE